MFHVLIKDANLGFCIPGFSITGYADLPLFVEVLMSDPDVAVEIALFKKAKEYTDLPVYFPNEVKPSTVSSAYVEVTHFRNNDLQYSLDASDGDTQYLGMLQMLVCAPKGVGPTEVRQRAADIVALFWTPANLSLSYGGVRVRVSKRPVLGTGVSTDTSYAVPVSIYYEVFI